MTEIWKAEFTLQTRDIEKIEHALWEVFENLTLYRHDDDKTKSTVEVIYEGEKNQIKMETILSDLCKNAGVNGPNMSFSKVPDINWLEHVYKKYPPVEAGRFFVHGGHVTQYPDDKIEISLNAATAFGTGEHGTTKGCLLALDELLGKEEFHKPLDMGCGAGVLAIAMAKVLKKKIIAIDNDPESTRVMIENAQINHVSDFIIPACGDGFKTDMVQRYAPYDLIIANILGGVLVEMAAQMSEATVNNGLIVLSGILQSQEEWVIGTYEKLGFSVLKKYPIDEWQTVVLRKKSHEKN